MLTVIEPIPEAVEAILHKIFRCSEVKPWINCSYISPCLTLCVGKARGSGKGNRRTQTFVNDALESYETNSLAIIEPEVPTPVNIYSAHGRLDYGVKIVKAYV